jgi:hypothetical protein
MPTAGETSPPDEGGVFAAKAAIAELITRHAALIDAGAWDEVTELYTEDGRMSRPSAPAFFIGGRAAILAALRSRPQRHARHIVANVLVTLESGTRARATSQVLLFGGTAAEGGGLPVLSAGPPLVGSSNDRLVRTAHGWRFAERRGSLDFRAPLPG